MTPGIRCTCLNVTGGLAVPDPSAGVTARLVGGPYTGVVVVLEPGTTRYVIGAQGWEPEDETRPAGEYVFVGLVEQGYSRFDWRPLSLETLAARVAELERTAHEPVNVWDTVVAVLAQQEDAAKRGRDGLTRWQRGPTS